MSEPELRRDAINKPVPEYPGDSRLKHHTGVAVAGIQFAPNGTMTEVRVLEAPDEAIAAAVKASVSAWTFAPVYIGGKAIAISGKLVFYFRIAGKEATVISPAEKFL